MAAAVVLLDQITKFLAVTYLEGKPPVELVGTLLQLNVIRNPGAAFSIGPGYTAIITVVAVTIVVVLVRTSRRLGSAWWAVCMGAMLGGAIGNLIDRFLRQPGVLRGHVVDFLQLPNWPIFNIADMAVVGAAVGMVILSIRGIDIDGTRDTGGRKRPETDGSAGPVETTDPEGRPNV